MTYRIVRLISLCYIIVISSYYSVSVVGLDPRFGHDGRVAVELGVYGDRALDPEFNFDGTVASFVGSSDDEILTLALQEDGKIIAAGYSSNGADRDFALARYNSDGSLDRNYDLEGLVVTPVGRRTMSSMILS